MLAMPSAKHSKMQSTPVLEIYRLAPFSCKVFHNPYWAALRSFSKYVADSMPNYSYMWACSVPEYQSTADRDPSNGKGYVQSKIRKIGYSTDSRVMKLVTDLTIVHIYLRYRSQ
jgi:hypothetical protein